MQRQFNFYLFAMSQDTMQGFAPAAFNAPMFQQPPPALPGAVGGNMGGVTNQPMNLNGMMGGMNAGSGGYRCGVMLISWGKKISFSCRDFGKGRGKGKGGKGGGKGKGRGGGKNNFHHQAPSVPLFEQGTKVEDITATSFEELGVHPRLCELLARNGFMAPFPIQSLCIPEALQGRDVCGKAKTGSGKTLAFGLPLLQMLEPTRERGYPSALILVPTRELALQVR